MDIDSSTDVTKKVCLCSFVSIILIILFIISPLSSFLMTSLFVKILILIILGYTIYLNNHQTNILSLSNNSSQNLEIQSQLSTNIICSYVFTLFLGILFIFVISEYYILNVSNHFLTNSIILSSKFVMYIEFLLIFPSAINNPTNKPLS